jgi:hypothetical protein
MGLISSIDARIVYRNAKAAFKSKNIEIKNNKLSNAYLRFEVPITSSQTSYDVPITITQQANGQGVQSITEQRLELQDSFFISHMAYYLNVPTSGGYTGLQDILYTFPATSFNANIDLDRINLFWNGFLKITVNNEVICPQWDLLRHKYVPEEQRPLNTTGNTFPWVFTDKNDGAQDGFYPVEPNWVLIGSRNNQMTINYPRQFDSTVITGGSTTIKAVIVVRGVLAQDSTPVR